MSGVPDPHVRGPPLLVLRACAAHVGECVWPPCPRCAAARAARLRCAWGASETAGGLEGASAVKRCMGVNNEFPIDRVDKKMASVSD